MPSRILILNGPNLNLLGLREPKIYGKDTLADIEKLCVKHGKNLGFTVDFRQSNMEGELVNWIQEAAKKHAGIVINAAGYSHNSVAILDALRAARKPVVEVHLSNLAKREEFRHHSLITAVSEGMICGFGAYGYLLALDAMARLVKKNSESGI